MFKNIFNTSKTVIYIDSKGNVKEIIDEEELLNKIEDELRNKSDVLPIDNFKKKYNIVENINSDNHLYYFKFSFKNKEYYKVGITSNSLENRYGSEFKKIERIIYFKKIDSCLKIERIILKEFKDNLFPLKYFKSGYSEVFDMDVLGLDNPKKGKFN
jgi:hypothetical protein